MREGRALLLAATVTGNPLPVVTWLHDGECVDASPDYVITYNNGECALRIEEALPQDGGVFVCKATNMLGSDQTGASVRVERESAGGSLAGGWTEGEGYLHNSVRLVEYGNVVSRSR